MYLFSQIFISQTKLSKKFKDSSFVTTLFAAILLPMTSYSIALFAVSGILCFFGVVLERFKN